MRQNSSPDVKVFLIGNKADLEDSRLINKEQALQLQKDYDLDSFMETSAKTGLNAQELFTWYMEQKGVDENPERFLQNINFIDPQVQQVLLQNPQLAPVIQEMQNRV